MIKSLKYLKNVDFKQEVKQVYVNFNNKKNYKPKMKKIKPLLKNFSTHKLLFWFWLLFCVSSYFICNVDIIYDSQVTKYMQSWEIFSNILIKQLDLVVIYKSLKFYQMNIGGSSSIQEELTTAFNEKLKIIKQILPIPVFLN